MHREAAQAHAEQELGERRVARHLAAHAHVLLETIRAGDRLRDQLQHGRMPGVVEMGDGLIGTIDGERVLREVVAADGKEVDVLRKRARAGRLLHPRDARGAGGYGARGERGGVDSAVAR